MPRVIGNDIPGNKRLAISLTYIYGIGRALAQEVIEKLGLDPNMRAHNLTEAEISKLNAILQNEYVVEGDLRRQVQNNIKRLISINCYRGTRHRSGLPLRGQRTRCNARTRKGKKKTVAGKKKAPQG
ncbi:MAG: 30S ribosomal protein S13 [Simkania sp.]|jgi:small subunit ribosomal protein S13|nr:30S ribosomal protein S13 [Simkania sp.]MCB1083566.1 30S ribosomal protein S13 [Simkania sp.]MCP5489699.1 30S ribosomal protein S13 [Chlamydiales bacterium]